MERRIFLEVVGSATLLTTFPATIPESTKIKPDLLVCPVLKVDSINSNNRLYPKAVIEAEVARYAPNVMLGQMEMPNTGAISFAAVSHRIKRIFMQDDWLMAEIVVLNTPSGKILQSLLDNKVEVVFRTAGIGACEVNENNILVIDESFKLTGIHALSPDRAVQYA